jgi:deazaflavin-dependent oxidoreductase (nitroreductase family)
MSARHAIGAVVVAGFAIVFMRASRAIRLLNPVFSRYLAAGLPAGPNVLLTVRGRSSGLSRRTPVAMLGVGDRRYLQAAFGEVGWVKNVRASGQVAVTKDRHTDHLDAVELPPEAAAAVMWDALAPFKPSRFLHSVVGPTIRPPAGVLRYFGVRIDETLEEYLAVARRQPIFELSSGQRIGQKALHGRAIPRTIASGSALARGSTRSTKR